METNWTIDDDIDLIHELYQTARMYSKTLNSIISSYGIYSSEWTLLHIIFEKGECSQSEMIRHLGVEPAAVSKTLTKMENKGLIYRESHVACRGKFITLTERGKEVCESLAEKVANHRQQAFSGLTTEERQQMVAFMHRIEQNLGGVNPEKTEKNNS